MQEQRKADIHRATCKSKSVHYKVGELLLPGIRSLQRGNKKVFHLCGSRNPRMEHPRADPVAGGIRKTGGITMKAKRCPVCGGNPKYVYYSIPGATKDQDG